MEDESVTVLWCEVPGDHISLPTTPYYTENGYTIWNDYEVNVLNCAVDSEAALHPWIRSWITSDLPMPCSEELLQWLSTLKPALDPDISMPDKVPGGLAAASPTLMESVLRKYVASDCELLGDDKSVYDKLKESENERDVNWV